MPNMVPNVKARQYSYGKTATGARVSWDPSSPNYIGLVNYVNPAAYQINVQGTLGTPANLGTYGTCQATYNNLTPTTACSVGSGPALYVPGTAPRSAAGNVWGQHYFDTDLSLKRSFAIYHEWRLQFGADVSNLTNHVVYATPTATPSSSVYATSNGAAPGATTPSTFGTISALLNKNNPREIQLSGRLTF